MLRCTRDVYVTLVPLRLRVAWYTFTKLRIILRLRSMYRCHVLRFTFTCVRTLTVSAIRLTIPFYFHIPCLCVRLRVTFSRYVVRLRTRARFALYVSGSRVEAYVYLYVLRLCLFLRVTFTLYVYDSDSVYVLR